MRPPHRRRSTRGELIHINFAIAEALDWLQARVERSAARHGDLVGPVLPAQRRASRRIDLIEEWRQEAEAGLGEATP